MVIRETEGVIQFAYHLSPPRDRDRTRARAEALEAVAAPFREAGLLGRDPARYEGLAYGNVSVREGPGYAITASQRSDQATLAAEDACWVALQRGVGGRLEAEATDRLSESLVHEASTAPAPRSRPSRMAIIPPSGGPGTPSPFSAPEWRLETVRSPSPRRLRP